MSLVLNVLVIVGILFIGRLITFVTGRFHAGKTEHIIREQLEKDRNTVIAESEEEQIALDVIADVRDRLQDKYKKLIGEKVLDIEEDFISLKDRYAREIYDYIDQNCTLITAKARKRLSKENLVNGKIGTVYCLLVSSIKGNRIGTEIIKTGDRLNVDFVYWFKNVQKEAMAFACDGISEFFQRVPITLYWYSRLQLELGPSEEQMSDLFADCKLTKEEAIAAIGNHMELEEINQWAKEEIRRYNAGEQMEMDECSDEELDNLADFANHVWYDFDEFPFTMIR